MQPRVMAMPLDIAVKGHLSRGLSPLSLRPTSLTQIHKKNLKMNYTDADGFTTTFEVPTSAYQPISHCLEQITTSIQVNETAALDRVRKCMSAYQS